MSGEDSERADEGQAVRAALSRLHADSSSANTADWWLKARSLDAGLDRVSNWKRLCAPHRLGDNTANLRQDVFDAILDPVAACRKGAR